MNPSTGAFISMDTYQGTIFDPTSLHKYLYANANPVMYIDPSGYSAENDISFYQQAWLTVEQAYEYETKLICNMHNEVSYDFQVMQIGREIIHNLKNTGLEYALTYVLEPYVGPDAARWIANGIVSSLDMAISSRNKAVSDKCGISNNNSEIIINDGVIDVKLSREKYPNYAERVENAIDEGYPSILTIDRANASDNRKAAIGGYDKVPGMDLDEYPPAMFAEGGVDASVVPLDRYNNRGAGATIGRLLKNYKDGQKIRITFFSILYIAFFINGKDCYSIEYNMPSLHLIGVRAC